ncbi:MAG: spondin domain-containing protein [Pseudomonadota bacterium]
MKNVKLSKAIKQAIVGAALATALAAPAIAEEVRVRVTIENLAPQAGTFQTPFWVGFHDATFDTYNGNTPASAWPIQGSDAMERICEDGTTGPISEDFATLVPGGVDATIPGPSGPIAPGEKASADFVLDGSNPAHRFFSYASMIIPSNDFCISNGNPSRHAVFDDAGNFIGEDFFVSGTETLDAGTEVNDEIPANTAFFGQAAPNTGVDENGVIRTLGGEGGFFPPGSGGILDDAMFAGANFSVPGYPLVKISFDPLPLLLATDFAAELSGDQEVPPVSTPSNGEATLIVVEDGERIDYSIDLRANQSNGAPLSRITMAHLHLAPAGENGPVVVNLLPNVTGTLIPLSNIANSISADDLVGPLAGQRLLALIDAMAAGEVYINIHTTRVPSGEIRGQIGVLE